MADRTDEREADILPSELALSLARTLREQAERLNAQAARVEGFHKPVADGISAIVKAAVGLADLVLAAEGRRTANDEDELMDVRAFFRAADERIDQLANERAAAMVAQRTVQACPACGASLRPAGDA